MLKYIWLGFLFALAALTGFWPDIDARVSGWFYQDGTFPAQQNLFNQFIHELAIYLPRVFGGLLLAAIAAQAARRRSFRAPLFLFLALVIGPGLIANLALKDQWGRARPLQTVEFGREAPFTPWWQPAASCDDNCSFVAGDGAFGFIMPALAFIMPRRRSWFWGGMGCGIVMGGNRIMMGAHFLSDVTLAALVMLATIIALHALMYGRKQTAAIWKSI